MTTQTEPASVRTQIVVEVCFIAETHRTRVELEHRHLGRHGEGWYGFSAGVGGEHGWPLYLRRYAALFTQGA